jgi:programmed cell death 6-interacting protein
MTISLLSWPQKQCYEIDMNKPIMKFIKRTFDNYDIESTTQACKELDELRRVSVNKALDANQKATETIARYHDQIFLLMAKVPLLENGVAVNFNWKDAFDARKQVNSQSGHWELACVLYNLAAIKTAVASTMNQSDADQQKAAVQLLTSAAGIADHLAATTVKIMHQERLTKDLQPTSLRAMSTVCVAQAQEMIILKAASAKAEMQGKLAQQAATLFADAIAQLKSAPAAPAHAIDVCNAKRLYYEARAQWKYAVFNQEKEEHGVATARYKLALAKAKEAKKAAGKFKNSGIDLCANRLIAEVEKLVETCEKDNNWIYHQKVPSAESLSAIPNQVLAKASEFKGKASSAPIADLFGHLVPLQVQSALTSFETRRKGAVQGRVNKITELNGLLDAVMQSLQVDTTVDAIFKSSGSALPPTITAAANNIRQAGGIAHLMRLKNGLGPAMQMNVEILDASQKMLDEEASKDEAYRVQFGVTKHDDPKWPRKPSTQLNHGYTQEIAKYRSIMTNAGKADGIVAQKLEANREGIEVLAGGDAQIAQYLGPGGAGGSSLQALVNDPAAIQLRDLREQARALKAVREVIEHQLRNEVALDMSEKFGMALAKDGFVDEETISTEALNELLQPVDTQIKEQEDSQDTVTRNLERVAEQVNGSKGGNNSAADIQRTQHMGLLVQADSAFKELSKHLAEGTKFYNDLTQLLLKNQSGIEDFCKSREIEAKELCTSLGGSTVTSAPVQKTTPPRPPPPSMPVAAPRTSTSGGDAQQATAPPTTGYQAPQYRKL